MATRSPRGRGQIASYGDGRTCAGPGCRTTLSRYNDSDLCWKHAEELARREAAAGADGWDAHRPR